MKLIQQQHGTISDLWQNKGLPAAQVFGTDDDAYATYYTSMYLIQDTAEPIDAHMASGFSTDPLKAYIEFFGVIQALIIQQDAIIELGNCLLGSLYEPTASSGWRQIRELRKQLVGHPANQGKPGKAKRSFFGRMKHRYEQFTFEQWDEATGQRSYPTVNLRAMITAYDNEAARVLSDVLFELKRKCP
jgi:hypothetical protein